MVDIIIFGGAPGSGKTTVGELLREQEGFPLFDFGWLRQGHLNNTWSNANEDEESMAFENLVFILNNYLKHGYKNVMINDLQDARVAQLGEVFENKDIKIISLVVSDDEELRKRVGGRDSGFTNVDEAVEWNRKLRERGMLPNEVKVDTTYNSPEQTVREILKVIRK